MKWILFPFVFIYLFLKHIWLVFTYKGSGLDNVKFSENVTAIKTNRKGQKEIIK